jgi:alpha-ketoglutarate-dependent taurine dioxygenase
MQASMVDIDFGSINIDNLTLEIDEVGEMSELEQKKFFELLNLFKFVILECNSSISPEKNILSLTDFLGSIKYHQNSNKDGIVPVTYSPGSPVSLVTTNEMAPMHTDGSFEIEPPKLVALQCEVPAKIGGISQIVYAQSVYEYLAETYPEELQNLFNVESFFVKLSDRKASHYIFKKLEENKISMIFRSEAGGATLEISPKVQNIFQAIKDYVNNPKNQLMFKLKANQILVLDNTSVLHGRTAFSKDEVRKLNKLWFDGKSKYTEHLQFGFIPKCSSAA